MKPFPIISAHWRGLSLALSSSLLFACGGGVALEEAPTEMALFFCKTVRDCGGVLGQLQVDSSCEATLEATFANNTFDQLGRAVDRGTIIYDASSMGQCISDSKALGCGVTGVEPRSCRETFIGTIALGSACAIDEECEGDRRCVSEGTACGVCQERVAEGGACSSDDSCLLGLQCVGQICRSGSVAGCGGEEGGGCPLDEICVGDDDGQTGECHPISERTTASLDETCSLAEERYCQPGLSCVPIDPLSDETFACKAVAATGGACRPGLPSQCPEGEYCERDDGSIDGNCQALPSEGQACADRGAAGRCAEGLSCIQLNDVLTCVLPQDNGAACTAEGQCYSRRCEEGLCVGPELCTL